MIHKRVFRLRKKILVTILNKICLSDIISEFPDVESLDCQIIFTEKEYDIFICALGFEDRCVEIPKKLADIDSFKCKHAYYFEYPTNKDDNEKNETDLLEALTKFSSKYEPIKYYDKHITRELREKLIQITKLSNKPKIIFDISSCSSFLILSTLKVLLEFDVSLNIVYSEAEVYHPTNKEYLEDPGKWTTEDFGLSHGVDDIFANPEYCGTPKERPNIVIVFPAFKRERTRKIIIDIDDSLSFNDEKRVYWLVGKPYMVVDIQKRRMGIIREINEIEIKNNYREVCTLDYKETLRNLDQLYEKCYLDSHLNISAQGSKMQSVGMAIFAYIRPDISIYHAIPKKYNPTKYTDGCKAFWQINFGDLKTIKNLLNKTDCLELFKESEKV